MVTLSNLSVSTPAVAAPAVDAIPDAPVVAAPAAKTRVNVLDASTATVTDDTGRVLKVRKLSALQRVRLFKAEGAINSENRMLGSYYSTAASVIEIDGAPVPFPSSELQLDALVGRLDEHGLAAAITALIALAPPGESTAAIAKN
jgi:hypothetical protein